MAITTCTSKAIAQSQSATQCTDFASGGDVSIIDVNGEEYCVHKFTSVGTSQFETYENLAIEYIIVGGGGGGAGAPGNTGRGGGGAGGFVEGSQNLATGSYTIIVGGGGEGGNSASGIGNTPGNGKNGGNSNMLGVTAIGGGGGGNLGNDGFNGGSGGGAGSGGIKGGGVQGQGNDGGDGFNNLVLYSGGGGGGGAGNSGENGKESRGGNGGAGISSDITGTAVFYAGGGGGSGITGGAGGIGGGGAGANGGNEGQGADNGEDGLPNTGGGGGATHGTNSTGLGGDGGSGIVIIRYKTGKFANNPTISHGYFKISETGTIDIDVGFKPTVIKFEVTQTNKNFNVETFETVNGEGAPFGWGHGFAKCDETTCENLALTVGSGSSSPNGMAAASSDNYSIYQIFTQRDGNGINGFMKAAVTSVNSNGFTVQVDEARLPNYVTYTAYNLEEDAEVDIGYFSTATSTGQQSINTGFKPNYLQVHAQTRQEINNVNRQILKQHGGDNGWGHGWAAERDGVIVQLTMAVSMHPKNIDYHSWGASDQDLLYVLRMDPKNKKVTGRIKANLSSFDDNGFTLNYSETDRGQIAIYMAIKTSADAEVGYFLTPTTSGTQQITTGTKLEDINFVVSNTIPSINNEGIINNSVDGHHGWMFGGGNTEQQRSMGFSSHSQSVNSHSSASSSTEAIYLLYTDRFGNIVGRDVAALTDITDNSFRLNWNNIATRSNTYVKNDQVLVAYHGFSEPANTWKGSTSRDWFNYTNWDLSKVPNNSSKIIVPAATGNQPLINSNFDVTIESNGELNIEDNAIVTLETSGGLNINNGAKVNTFNTGQIVLEPGSNYLNRSDQDPKLVIKQRISGSKGWRMISSPIVTGFDDLLSGNFVTQGFTGSDYPDKQPNLMWWDETEAGTTLQGWRTASDISDNTNLGRGYFHYVFDGAGVAGSKDTYSDNLPLILSVTGTEPNIEGSNYSYSNVSYTPRDTTSQSSAEDDIYIDRVVADQGFNLVGNPTASTLDWDAAGWSKTNISETIYIWDPAANNGNGDYLVWNGSTGSLGSGIIAPMQSFWVQAIADNPSLSFDNSVKSSLTTFRGKTTPSEAENRYMPGVKFTLEGKGYKKDIWITLSKTGKKEIDKWDAFHLSPMTDSWVAFYSTFSGEGNAAMTINNLPLSPSEQVTLLQLHTAIYSDYKPLEGQFSLTWEQFGEWPNHLNVYLQDDELQSKVKIGAMPDSISFYLRSPVLTESQGNIAYKNASKAPMIPGLPASLLYPSANGATPSNMKTYSGSSNGNRFSVLISRKALDEFLPTIPTLYQNYPNPFNPETTIQFSLPEQSNIKLQVFDILGREVAQLANGNYEAGVHRVRWDASRLSSGVYLYRLISDGQTIITKKMTLLK